MTGQLFCEKCGRTHNEDDFYQTKNLEKYPSGRLSQCKKCITMHIDNFDPQTYLWILQEADVPYIPDEWNKLLATYGKDRSKLSGMTIFGRYLSKMKLKQYKDFRWEDTEHLQEMANNKIETTMKRQGYSAVEIAEAINKSTFTLSEEILTPPSPPQTVQEELAQAEDYFDDGATDALVAELTEEDKLYLRLKWGKAYKPAEWIELEKLYNEMMASYDIQSAGHIDTLKLVCKTSLKANQLLDIGDVDGAQKMLKMYDSLMKSGKFQAAQNKAENGEAVDSISELVAMCERDGFIPRYYTDGPQDKVDRTIQDLQEYTTRLITEEMHLGPLIERAVHQIEKDRDAEVEVEDEDDDELLERELYEQEETIIEDEDYDEFNQMREDESARDLALLLEEADT